MCVNGCRYNSSCQYDASCTSYIEAQSSVAGDLCDIANNYDGYCTNTNSPSVGVKLDPATNIRSETYTNNGKSSTRTYYEGTLKNVNIIVNGSPQIAAQIGGGAHIDKTVKFEGSNSISGGSQYSVGPEDIIPTHMVLSAAFCRLIPVQHYLWEKQPAFTISGTEQLSETARFPEP